MPKTQRKKIVHLQMMNEKFTAPAENQQIVRVLGGKGANLHEVEASDGSTFLASMPTRFRKSFWIKRNNFVFVEDIEEGMKVKAEIVKILTPEHIDYLKEIDMWPHGFGSDSEKGEGKDSDGDGDEDDLVENTNRLVFSSDDSTDDSESEDSESEPDNDESDLKYANCTNKENT